MLNSIFAGTRMAASLIEAVTSGPAIIIYVAVLLVIVTALVITVMVNESGKKEDAEQKMIIMPSSEKEEEKEKDKENGTGERFCMLSEIDRNSGKYGRMFYEKGVTLESFC
ncbi:MAG: hypothetical protein IJA86_09730, partial [Clostridia bacterium]|nr:hypothetical protein [Clostridia bacterium]